MLMPTKKLQVTKQNKEGKKLGRSWIEKTNSTLM